MRSHHLRSVRHPVVARAQVGAIKRVIMGLNRFTKEPCGFCFVE